MGIEFLEMYDNVLPCDVEVEVYVQLIWNNECGQVSLMHN